MMEAIDPEMRQPMQYRMIGDERLSHLGMGCMRLPSKRGRIDSGQAQGIIDYAMAHGINYFDTAYIYNAGGSEKFLGRALRKYPRDSYHLATKYFGTGISNYRKVFEKQLERLGADYIDFYLIHSVMDLSAPVYKRRGSIEYFMEQKKQGRIRYLGFSSHSSPKTLDSFASYCDWDFVQLQLNYYDWAFGTAREEYRIAVEHGLPIVVMEPIRGGKLASLSATAQTTLDALHPDWSAASWALRWVMRLDGVKVVLSGMSTLEQIQENIQTFETTALNDLECETLLQTCGAIKEQLTLPCTGCRYCCDSCPKGIDIPMMLDIYNKSKLDGEDAVRHLLKSSNEHAGPGDCIGCKACMTHCPQSIDIPAALEELAGL